MPMIVHADNDLSDRWDFKYLVNGLDPSIDVLGFTDGLSLIQHMTALKNVELPSLIFLDLVMPVWDGIKTLQTLKSEPRFIPIPVYMWSSRPTQKEIDLCLHSGAEQFFFKPTNDEERLRERIKLAALLTKIEGQ